MKRKFTSYLITDYSTIKTQVLNFGKRYSTFCFLDSHQYNFQKSYECIAGAGIISQFAPEEYKDTLNNFDKFCNENNDWIFGHISYDLKNEIEDLSSSNFDGIDFPLISFFVPEIVFIISNDKLQIGVGSSLNSDEIFNEIISDNPIVKGLTSTTDLKGRYSRDEYIETVKNLQDHILKGDCYEINFCQEFYSDNVLIDPIVVHNNLNRFSPNPFSAFYKYNDKFLMCASPERFIKKIGNTIISQPIKGTARRINEDKNADDIQKKSLLQNKKERAENIMIVDMVRNDLSKICKKGSVKVEDFLGLYTFPQVHQMISTITGVLREGLGVSEIFKAMFPMGSMTGAPKKRVMELIEKYEKTKRGLFSGTVGYINPEGDFDFNVVIRSVQYNSSNQYLSISTGSAITFNSIPEDEYEECILKLSAMKIALESL